ncbi:hypothetical protein [Novipirellula herctigrandis]|uniref:hypothetical protein n=1 Tax=Novipirellula herctigrandis TaxID=2527986 RepID=UPI003AF35146
MMNGQTEEFGYLGAIHFDRGKANALFSVLTILIFDRSDGHETVPRQFDDFRFRS